MVEYGFHEYCLLFPQASNEILRDMAEDIKTNGLNRPVVLFDGKILDGRNRYLACQAAGIEPNFVEYTGNDPLHFVISENLHRRHLNESQRALLAGRILEKLRKTGTPVTRKDMEDQFQVSRESMRVASRVKKLGSDELQKSVASGVMSLNKAAKVVSQAKKLAGVDDESAITPLQKEAMERAETKIIKSKLSASDVDALVADRKERDPVDEFHIDVLTGVYNGGKYRETVRQIQDIIARMNSLPSKFEEAVSLTDTVQKQKILKTALNMLSDAIDDIENGLHAHSISYDEVMSLVANLLKNRFLMPQYDGEIPEEELVEQLRMTFLTDCVKVKEDITKIIGRLNQKQ